jgi:translation initiation factor 1
VPSRALVPPNQQTARLSVERRKKGKLVTLVRGLAAEANDLPALLTRLKNDCGAGGTLDGATLELQGDQLARLRGLLSALGYRVRG